MDKPPAYGDGTYPAPGFAPGFAPGAPPPMMVQPGVPTQVINVVPTSGSVQYGDQPVTVICGNCNERVVSQITYEAGSFTYLCAFGLALFVWCGCCLIPCCVDSCKDVHHYCPRCHTQLGIFKRL